MTLGKSFKTWMAYVEWKREKKRIISRWKQPLMVGLQSGLTSLLHMLLADSHLHRSAASHLCTWGSMYITEVSSSMMPDAH